MVALTLETGPFGHVHCQQAAYQWCALNGPIAPPLPQARGYLKWLKTMNEFKGQSTAHQGNALQPLSPKAVARCDWCELINNKNNKNK